jgi:hypothetical protein
MAPETPNPDEHLLPAKHGKGDLFICDVADAVLKDLIPVWRQLLFPVNDNYSSRSATTTSFPAA